MKPQCIFCCNLSLRAQTCVLTEKYDLCSPTLLARRKSPYWELVVVSLACLLLTILVVVVMVVLVVLLLTLSPAPGRAALQSPALLRPPGPRAPRWGLDKGWTTRKC